LYRLHKQSGQAIVTLRDALGNRRDVLLGRYGSAESRAEYARVIGEWEANSQRLPQAQVPAAADLRVSELLLAYWRWAEQHYRDDENKPSRELDNLKDAFKPLRQLYGHTSARSFGPLSLRSVQETMVKAGLCRNVVNYRINRVRRVFKWASSCELLPVVVYEALRTLPGLQRGRGAVRETSPVAPVPVEHVHACLPHLPTPVRAMVEVQLLTGCRAGEVMVMRALDLNTSEAVWTYRPHGHKNRHRGRDRIIFLGPQAQGVIKPFLTTNLEAYLFGPPAHVEALHARRAAARRTKRTPSYMHPVSVADLTGLSWGDR
jgi:integrase